MGQMAHFDSVHRQKIPVAEVKLSNDDLAHLSGLPNSKSRTALLSMIAAKEALNDAGIENVAAFRTGFISANTVGGMDKTENFLLNFFPIIKKGDCVMWSTMNAAVSPNWLLISWESKIILLPSAQPALLRPMQFFLVQDL